MTVLRRRAGEENIVGAELFNLHVDPDAEPTLAEVLSVITTLGGAAFTAGLEEAEVVAWMRWWFFMLGGHETPEGLDRHWIVPGAPPTFGTELATSSESH